MLKSEEYDEFEPGMVADVVQLLPEHYVKHLAGKNCDIIYFITSDVTAEERFALHRKYDTKKDYTYEFTDEEMRWHCNYVVEHSKLLKRQCEEYDLRFYETAKERERVFKECMLN